MQCIVCGLGGQGVITLNSIIGELASKLGLRATSAETHGMAMRGGSVYTSIKISQSLCPTVAAGSATLLLSTDAREVDRNIKFLSKNGLIISDGQINDKLPFKQVSIDAKKAAADIFGNPKHTNTILLGVVIASFPKIFPVEKSIEILEQNKKINIDALNYGIERGIK